MKTPSRVVVSGSFDDLRSHHVRLLQEAAQLGTVHLLLWSDDMVRSVTGQPPKFPEAERAYLVEAIRYVEKVWPFNGRPDPNALPQLDFLQPQIWAVDENADTEAKRAFCNTHSLEYRVFTDKDLVGFPMPKTAPSAPDRKKVIVTGCFDWFHSGHVRFFEEVSQLGDLYVIVGHDKNLRLLKGEGHPVVPQSERLYMVGSVRHVKEALISTGHGWLDAEPEIYRIKPDLYVVNEDGDKPEKREFCRKHGLQYVIFKRTPKEGLTGRTSTSLRESAGSSL
ncbi:MAG TPA: adenylyltransferase/cytidyltransferase family protein [Verrucomicrobiae bacterium]|nr:adenylyltransferase/cytidyltransferase family protein [Verrucomicrobiae bacterium]